MTTQAQCRSESQCRWVETPLKYLGKSTTPEFNPHRDSNRLNLELAGCDEALLKVLRLPRPKIIRNELLANPVECFWKQVVKSQGCWIWIGYRNWQGYGIFWDGSQYHPAHRYSLELTGVFLPHDWKTCTLHKCDTPFCVNPSHLFVGSRELNIYDMHQKKRFTWSPELIARLAVLPKRIQNLPRGEDHKRAKLTNEQVAFVRAQVKFKLSSREALARDFGVCRATIDNVVNRVCYKHLP